MVGVRRYTFQFGLTVFAFFVALPVIVSQSYWAITPYIEHADTDLDEANNSRTVTSGVLKVLLLGYTYHLCHHLHPRVQLHRLPALYRYLQAQGALPDKPVVESSMLTALRIGATSPLKF